MKRPVLFHRSLVFCWILAAMTVEVVGQIFPNLGGQRAGISAISFLKMEHNPRTSGMGGAAVAITGDPFACQWNPAAITDLTSIQTAVSATLWPAGLNQGNAVAVLPTLKYGSFGISAAALTSGPMEKRTEYLPNGTGETFYVNNTSVGITYAKTLTEMFSYGLTARYINESIDQFSAHTAAFDLGFAYKTDFKGLRFAVVVNNFGLNSRLKPKLKSNMAPIDIESYPAPTVFSIGASMKVLKNERNTLLAAFQLNHPNDNAENLRLGLEYTWRSLFYLRAGYKINVPDQKLPTAGVGFNMRIRKNPLQLDYMIEPMQRFGWAQRISLTIIFNNEKRSDPENSTFKN